MRTTPVRHHPVALMAGTLTTVPKGTRNTALTFWDLVDKSDPDGCWPWTGHTSRFGYGRITWQGHDRTAHSLAYELAVGIPDPGLVIDHQCHNASTCEDGPSCPHRRCCRPDHLRAVTQRENILAGRTLAAANAAKTACPQGHPYATDGRTGPDGRRYCKACKRQKALAYYHRTKAV